MGQRAAHSDANSARRRALITAVLLAAVAGLVAIALFAFRDTGINGQSAPEKQSPGRASSTPSSSAYQPGTPRPSESTPSSEGSEPSASPEKRESREPESSKKTDASSGVSQAVATRDGVTVKRPVAKPSGNGMWVAVDIANQGQTSATYEVEIRITGPDGFSATVRATTQVLGPGYKASQALTAMDASGAPVPKQPKVQIIDVTRTPA